MKKFRIIDGTFAMPGGVIAQAGDVIDLEPDVAAQHAGRLVEVPDEAPAPTVQTPALDHNEE